MICINKNMKRKKKNQELLFLFPDSFQKNWNFTYVKVIINYLEGNFVFYVFIRRIN